MKENLLYQFKKGALEFIVLGILDGQERYGYEIIGQLNAYKNILGEAIISIISTASTTSKTKRLSSMPKTAFPIAAILENRRSFPFPRRIKMAFSEKRYLNRLKYELKRRGLSDEILKDVVEAFDSARECGESPE